MYIVKYKAIIELFQCRVLEAKVMKMEEMNMTDKRLFESRAAFEAVDYGKSVFIKTREISRNITIAYERDT